MEWTHLDTATQNESIFDLYEHDGIYTVRVDGMELMNGYWHESEDVLGYLTVQLARVARPRVLIGGLGLGYTLASASAAMEDEGMITVAEVSGAVIGWYKQYMLPGFFPALPANVRIVESNIVALLQTGETFDVIALDVDNGPEPLAQAGNGFLYSWEGMEAAARCLGPSGVLMVWSGFESIPFMNRARAAGFWVDCKVISFVNQPACQHFIYVLSRLPFSDAELALIKN